MKRVILLIIFSIFISGIMIGSVVASGGNTIYFTGEIIESPKCDFIIRDKSLKTTCKEKNKTTTNMQSVQTLSAESTHWPGFLGTVNVKKVEGQKKNLMVIVINHH